MSLQELFGLNGRIALVTGGSRGIGLMIARGLIDAGCARVYLTARKADALNSAVAELGEKAVALAGDLSTIEGIEALAGDLAAREERLDLLVNNAGAAWGAPFEAFPESGWDKTLDLNLKTPFFLTQKLHPLLKAAGASGQPAKVIMVASIDGMAVNAWETYPYQASKAALIHLTRRMAARLIRDNIVVSGIAPGAFASEMNKAARDNADFLAKMIPAGRIGSAEDMAAAAIYLASRAGDYVVGTTIAVDGGLVNASLPGSFSAP